MARQIAAARATYTLGFYLSEQDRDNKVHALAVETDRRGLHLYYRQSYYAGNTELPDTPAGKGDLQAVLLNRVNSTGVGITSRIDAKPGNPRGTLTITLNLDPATVSLQQHGSGWAGRVDETFIEQNVRGNTLSRVSDTKQFEMTAANRATFETQGVTWPMSMPLMEGATKLTIVVRDSKTGHLGSLTIPLP